MKIHFTFLFLHIFSFCNAQEEMYDFWRGKTIPFAVTGEGNLLGFGKIVNRTYDKEISFDNAVFSEGVYFSQSIFKKKADFGGVYFKKDASFFDTKFLQGANFKGSFYEIDGNFIGTEFLKETFFHWSIFKKDLFFREAHFYGDVSFEGCDFSKGADFSNSSFSKNANFSYSNFGSTLNVESIYLPSNLFFKGVRLKYDVRFDLSKIDSLQKRKEDKCKIFLDASTELDKLVLDASKFELCFDSTIQYDEKLAVFEQIIRKSRNIGFNESAKGFDIEFQKVQIRHNWGFFAPPIIWISEYWWNFGYDKSKAYRNTAVAFFLSFLLFFICFRYFLKVYLPPQIRLESHEINNLSWATRFKTSIFYTALIFFTWKMEHQEVKYKEHPWGTLIIYFVFTLGIIHLAYLAGAILNK